MIIRPRYLDQELVEEVLDGLGLDVPGQRAVRETTSRGRQAEIGVKHGVSAGVGSRRRVEREESFSESARPVLILHAALNALREQGELVDLAAAPDTAISKRLIIEVPATLAISPASEIAPLFGAVVDALTSGYVDSPDDLRPEQFVQQLLGAPAGSPVVMVLEPEAELAPFVTVLKPECLYRAKSFEDLEGDATVLAIVDRVLGRQEPVSLERWLFPQLPRAVRRALSQEGIDQLLADLEPAIGRRLERDDLVFTGPGAVITTVAIYR